MPDEQEELLQIIREARERDETVSELLGKISRDIDNAYALLGSLPVEWKSPQLKKISRKLGSARERTAQVRSETNWKLAKKLASSRHTSPYDVLAGPMTVERATVIAASYIAGHEGRQIHPSVLRSEIGKISNYAFGKVVQNLRELPWVHENNRFLYAGDKGDVFPSHYSQAEALVSSKSTSRAPSYRHDEPNGNLLPDGLNEGTQVAEVYKAIRDGSATREEIFAVTGVPKDNISVHAGDLIKRGLVNRPSRGNFTLPMASLEDDRTLHSNVPAISEPEDHLLPEENADTTSHHADEGATDHNSSLNIHGIVDSLSPEYRDKFAEIASRIMPEDGDGQSMQLVGMIGDHVREIIEKDEDPKDFIDYMHDSNASDFDGIAAALASYNPIKVPIPATAKHSATILANGSTQAVVIDNIAYIISRDPRFEGILDKIVITDNEGRVTEQGIYNAQEIARFLRKTEGYPNGTTSVIYEGLEKIAELSPQYQNVVLRHLKDHDSQGIIDMLTELPGKSDKAAVRVLNRYNIRA
jgi:hypothetical protein